MTFRHLPSDHLDAPTSDASQRPDVASRPGGLARRVVLQAAGIAGLVGVAGRAAAATKTTKKKTTTKKTSTTAASTATTVATTKAATATTAKAATASGAPFDEALEMAVGFTFAVSGGGFAKNPYVAVFLEDASGASVRTIDISVELGRGLRYVEHLTRWNGDDQTRISKGGKDIIETISSATRVPGTYEVVWDGKDDAGKVLPQGTYTLYVEAAREHGPYELVKGDLSIGTAKFEKNLGSNGELQNVTVKLRAKS